MLLSGDLAFNAMIQFLKSFFTEGGKCLHPDCLSTLSLLFNEEYYLEQNPDVLKSKISPFDHYKKNGFKERRLPCAVSEIAESVKRASQDPEYIKDATEYSEVSFKETFAGKKLVLPYHRRGNFFFKEISQHIADAALEIGVDAELVDESRFKKMQMHEGLHCFFVAPQEFFYLGRRDRLHQHAKRFMPEVTYLLAEQPQTVFFLSQLEYVFDDVHIVDMNFHAATYLRSLGLDCHYLPLNYSASLMANKMRQAEQSVVGMHIPKVALESNDMVEALNRPIDAVFIGNGCERRQRFFSKYCGPLSQFDLAVFMPDWSVPHSSGGLATLDANDSIALCQRSKIFLNIHRDEFEYFEWHRICMRGFLSGSLVLTEPVFEVPEFQAGVHYIECHLDEMPEKIAWLLNAEEGREQLVRVASAGKEAYLATSMVENLSDYLAFIYRARSQ